MSSYGRLEHAVATICASRGISLDQGKAAFADLIRVLHETAIKARYPEGGVAQQIYFVLGAEAAYHYGGMLSCQESSAITETLQRLDPKLTRFKHTLDRWLLELQQDTAVDET